VDWARFSWSARHELTVTKGKRLPAHRILVFAGAGMSAESWIASPRRRAVSATSPPRGAQDLRQVLPALVATAGAGIRGATGPRLLLR